jgi:hypothetical protein
MQKAAYGEICGGMLLRPHDLVHRYALHYLHVRRPTRLVLRRNNKRRKKIVRICDKSGRSYKRNQKGPCAWDEYEKATQNSVQSLPFRGRFAGTQILYVNCVPVDSQDGKAQPKDLTVCPGGGLAQVMRSVATGPGGRRCWRRGWRTSICHFPSRFSG